MSAAVAAAAAAAAAGSQRSSLTSSDNLTAASLAVSYRLPCYIPAMYIPREPPTSSMYESQKQGDWNTFGQYLCNHTPPVALHQCRVAHVLEFLRYLDQFGKTKVHSDACPFYGRPSPPVSCPCPLRQAWGSLDALVGRLRAAYEENGGTPHLNPFRARAVRLYLMGVRDTQAKARGNRVLEEAEEEADATIVAARGAAGSVSARSSRYL